MKDLHSNIEVTSILHPIGIAATATYTDIDLAGANSAELVIDIGLDAALEAAASWTFTLKDSPDGTTYTAVEDADMLGVTGIAAGLILTVDSTDEDNTIYHYGYVGGQRYLELIVTEAGTALTGPMCIMIIKGHLQDSPVIA